MNKNLKKKLYSDLNESVQAKSSLLESFSDIDIAIIKITKSLKSGGKVIFCGNGGSAADAQHLAAELMVRLRPKINRRPLPAISIVSDTSTITACSNDYDFNQLFSRNLEALGKKKDILIIISTSGNSKNILNVLKMSRKLNIFSIGFLGNRGGAAKKNCNLPIIVKSSNTARIQEAHIFLGHFILESVENNIFKLNKVNYK